ncbi:hypothetical protein Vretimale_13508 [Volvox reticuliferus]|uniref:Uncharacterized protein n=1 Tax=Volvox reticuliferus TaxID=1737510 RepID=A0A8J4FF35_9CHLO|nr:hypothetical protein Vretifemale_360 [Volvox reticuliferus]GIM09701.1 hypothetical protein Vretimale_13508 [Volvox reticuliferus]
MDRSGQSQSAKPRKELNWWHSFNSWWRDEYDKLGRRPRMQEVDNWYREHAEQTWGVDKPSLEATRDHAKCLRSKKELREYFQRYHAKKQLGASFTDMRQMRGRRQRSGSQQLGTGTQPTRSNSDPGVCGGGGGGGTSGGTSGGLSGALSSYEGCCDGSSGGGDASGGNPGTNQTAASTQLLSAITGSPNCTGTGNGVQDPERNQELRVQGREPDRTIEDGVVAGPSNGVSGGPSALAPSALAGGPDGDDAQLLGRLQEMCASAHIAMQQYEGDDGRDDRGGSAPSRLQSSSYKLQHGVPPATESSCGLGCTDNLFPDHDANKMAAKVLANCNHHAATLNCQLQPDCSGGDGNRGDGGGGGGDGDGGDGDGDGGEGGGGGGGGDEGRVDGQSGAEQIHIAMPGAAAPGSSPAVLSAPTVSHRGASNVRQHTSAAMPSPRSQPHPLHGHSSVPNTDGHGSAGSAESHPGKTALVTRLLEDLASTALGRRIFWDPEALPEQGAQRTGANMGAPYVCSAAANAIAAGLLEGKAQDPGTLLITAARRAVKQHESMPSPPSAAAAPRASHQQHRNQEPQMLLTAHVKAPNEEPVVESNDRMAAMTSSEPRGMKAATLAAERGPSVRPIEDATVATAAVSPGEADAVMHDPEGRGNVGQSATPSSQEQPQHQPQYQPANDRNAVATAAGANDGDSAAPGQLLLASHCFAVGGHVGGGDDTDYGDGGRRGSGSPSPAPDGGSPEPPTLGLAEPSLSALPDPPSATETGDGEPASGVAHLPPLSCRSSGAFTGCVDDAEATGGSSATVSAGSKRSAGALELIRTPSLRVPGAPDGDVAETPNLHRAPKRLRLEHAQQGTGWGSLRQRGSGDLSVGGGRTSASRHGSGILPGGGIHSGSPPEPFRTPMLLFQRSIGKEGLSGLGSVGLTSSFSVLHARESASTRVGMPSQLSLLPRESVGTANVPPALAARESLETRLMPPPSLPLHERSSVVRSQPSSAIASQQNYPADYPQDLLQQQMQRKHQEQRQGHDRSPVFASGLDPIAVAAAAFVDKPGGRHAATAQPPPLVRDGGGGISKANGRAAAEPLPPSTGLTGRLSNGVQFFLQSRDIERMCVRQPLDDGRLLEAQMQVITVRLSLPATAIGALRQAQPR